MAKTVTFETYPKLTTKKKRRTTSSRRRRLVQRKQDEGEKRIAERKEAEEKRKEAVEIVTGRKFVKSPTIMDFIRGDVSSIEETKRQLRMRAGPLTPEEIAFLAGGPTTGVPRTIEDITPEIAAELDARKPSRGGSRGGGGGTPLPDLTQEELDELVPRPEYDNQINNARGRRNRLINKVNLTFNERKLLQAINNKIKVLEQSKRRSQLRSEGFLTRADERDIITTTLGKQLTREARGGRGPALQGSLVLLGFAQTFVSAYQGLKQSPATVAAIVRNPKSLAKLPQAIALEGARFGALIKTSPSTALGQIGGELFLLKGSGKVFKVAGKLTRSASNKILNLNPTLLKIEGGVIKVSKGKGKTINLRVGTITNVKESVARQLTREGKQVVAVTAQADRLVGFLKRKRLILKPFNFDTGLLTKRTRDMLNKFEKGLKRGKVTLTPKQMVELNLRLRKETKKLGVQQKGVDLLERSTYFDPDKVIRKSRLFLKESEVPDASFIDLLRGRATLFQRRARPQIIVLEDVVERIPKTKEFASIRRKLERSRVAGKDPNLTKVELAKLTRFQVTPSGKLKPIGSTTYQGGLERELTLAPGEVIQRVKKLGTLKVGQKRIPIVAVRIVKGKRNVGVIKKIEALKEKIKQLRIERNSTNKFLKKKKLTPSQKKKLIQQKKRLTERIKKKGDELDNIKTKKASKEVKKFLRESRRRPKPRKKVFRVGKRLTRAASLSRARPRAKPRARKRVRPRAKPRPRPRPRPKPRPRPRPRPKQRPRPRPGARPRPGPRPPARRGPRPPARPPVTLPRKSKGRGRKKRKPTRGYNVYAKPVKGKKLLKVNKVPLTKTRAKDVRNYVTDTSLGRTARIKPTKGRPKRIRIKVPAGYSKATTKKFRRYRIVKGRRVPIVKGRVIEKGRNILDTKQEKKKITVRRRIAQLEVQPKRGRNGLCEGKLLADVSKGSNHSKVIKDHYNVNTQSLNSIINS